MIMLAKLEKDDSDGGTNARRAGFRSRMRSAISQLLVTGDVLIQMTDEYQIRIHRRDNYVVRRSTSGDVMYMITREQVDSLSLSPEQIEMIGLDLETEMNTPAYDRMQDLYTKCEWNPMSKRWVVEQQIKDVTIVTSEEKVSPYFAIPYSLPPTGHYGRGIIEENLGDVRAINELTERLLDFAARLQAPLRPDYSSQVRPQDLALQLAPYSKRGFREDRSPMWASSAPTAPATGVVQNVRESLSRDLSKVMMMEAEQLPTYERASRLHVERVAMELEGALGGVYAPIADALQIPLVERLMHLLERDGVMPSLPADSVEVEAVTGISALSREGDQQKLLQLLQTIAQMGPDMMQRFAAASCSTSWSDTLGSTNLAWSSPKR